MFLENEGDFEMSRQRNIKINCPRCGRRIDMTVWDVVDANMTPDLPQLLVSGEFFRHSCPECDQKINLEMPLLYNDVNNRARIWLLESTQNLEDEMARLGMASLGNSVPGERTRRVSSNNEFREKVGILEAGRDDRVIEVVKYLALQDFRMKHPGESVAGVRYACLNGREALIYFNDEGAEHEAKFDIDVYEEWDGYLRAIVRTMNMPEYSVVDQKFAEDVLYGFFGQMMGEAKNRGVSVLQMRQGKQPPVIDVPDLSENKPKKKGGKAILWIIIALIVLLIGAGTFVVLQYNVFAPKTAEQAVGEVIESKVDLGNMGVAGEDEIIQFIPQTGD